MNPDPNKSRLEHKQQTTEEQRQEHTQQGRTFESVEEMLRFDAQQTNPPPAIAARLKESLAAKPPARRGWWRRLFTKEK